ncbi:MAG TPA: hypothetical protein VMT62_09390 [Syntrophorhabdaceae bacterium]|nr:hypothetical protein [Syntrophorhabdaceae bacterium]
MDTQERSSLAERYKEQSDEEIKELLESGPDSFEKEAYEILLMEAKRRSFDKKSADVTENDITKIEKPLEEMTRGEILELFMSARAMNKDVYNALCAEALRRDICLEEINQFRKGISELQNSETDKDDADTTQFLGNPFPLIIAENVDEIEPFLKALSEAQISYDIQIMVDEKDYEKAEEVVNGLKPPNDIKGV